MLDAEPRVVTDRPEPLLIAEKVLLPAPSKALERPTWIVIESGQWPVWPGSTSGIFEFLIVGTYLMPFDR